MKNLTREFASDERIPFIRRVKYSLFERELYMADNILEFQENKEKIEIPSRKRSFFGKPFDRVSVYIPNVFIQPYKQTSNYTFLELHDETGEEFAYFLNDGEFQNFKSFRFPRNDDLEDSLTRYDVSLLYTPYTDETILMDVNVSNYRQNLGELEKIFND